MSIINVALALTLAAQPLEDAKSAQDAAVPSVEETRYQAGWQISPALGLRHTTTTYTPEQRSDMNLVSFKNVAQNPSLMTELALRYRFTYVSIAALFNAYVNRVRLRQTTLSTLSYLEIPLSASLDLGIHPYLGPLSFHSGVGYATIFQSTTLEAADVNFSRSRSNRTTVVVLHTELEYQMNSAMAVSVRLETNNTPSAQTTGVSLNYSYTFGGF